MNDNNTTVNIDSVNVVGMIDFHRELDLAAVSNLLETSEVVSEVNYSPEEYHWLQTRFRLNGDSKYVAFYRSGSCALVGCDSFDRINQLAELIENVMEPVIRKAPTLEIKNLVCIGELNQKLNLTNTAIAAGLEKVEYEPEQFPGLIYRSNESIILVFASGKVIITGVNNIESANQSFQSFIDELAEWGLKN